MATDKEKLDTILTRLQEAALPSEKTHQHTYWMEVECRCDNATDSICDYDEFIKQLIEYIET